MTRDRWLVGLFLAMACSGEGSEPASESSPVAVVEKASPDRGKSVSPPALTSLPAMGLQDMAAESWKRFNTRDFPGFAALHRADAIWTEANGDGVWKGRDAIFEQAKTRTRSFSDLRGEPMLVLVHPPTATVFEMALVTGTHTGSLPSHQGDIPATAKRFGILTAQLLEIEDGLIARRFEVSDAGAPLGQLGVSDRPVRPAVTKPWHDPVLVVADDAKREASNLTRIERFYRAFNARKTDAIMETFSKEALVLDQSAPDDFRGKDAIEKQVKLLLGAFADFEIEVESLFAAGSYVVAWGRARGTNTGAARSWGLRQATGKRADVGFLEVFELEDGKITKVTRIMNGLALIRQLGLAVGPIPQRLLTRN